MSLSMCCDPALKIFWRINVPQVGFSPAFVMRSILAISCLHLACAQPEKRGLYVPYSMTQHQLALREAVTVLPNITTENCVTLHIFSAITCFYTLGCPRTEESGIGDRLDLFCGVQTIIESSPEALRSGPLEPMFKAGRRRM
ncbi:hypothetical protein B0J14DRAFT_592981 [Halenospora varia]|nr:hypothetical protein B0J14DRAFT_592981 [Halenospora varia]